MSRLYDVDKGEVAVGGVGVAAYALDELRGSVVGVLQQEPFVFSGSLLENVACGGDCVDGMEDYTCSCMPPWSGRNCEINFKCPEESWDQEKANVRHVCFNGRAVQHYNLPEVRPNALAPAEKGRVLVEAVRN